MIAVKAKELDTAWVGIVQRARKRLGEIEESGIGVRWLPATFTQKDIDGGRTEIEGIATCDAVDCDDEVVLPDGLDWSVLERFKGLYVDHLYGVEHVVATLRRVSRVREPNGWKVHAVLLPDDYSADIRRVKELASRGALGLSIGFQAIDRGAPTDEERRLYPRAMSIVRRARVFEVSYTPMPCNVLCATTGVYVSESRAADAAALVRKGYAPPWFSPLLERGRQARRMVVLT